MKNLRVLIVFTVVLASCFIIDLSFADKTSTDKESTSKNEKAPCINYLSAKDCKPRRAVFVDRDGNVGIGILPAQHLHVRGSTAINGKLGIGTTIPKEKLDVNGGIAINGNRVIDNTGKWVGDPTGLIGPQGPPGEQGPPGIGIGNTYDSGWFPVSATTIYTKDHNLGTDKVLVCVYSATDSIGTGMMLEGGIMNGSTHYAGITVYNITHSKVSIFVNNTFRFIANLPPTNPEVSSGYARIIMISLN